MFQHMSHGEIFCIQTITLTNTSRLGFKPKGPPPTGSLGFWNCQMNEKREIKEGGTVKGKVIVDMRESYRQRHLGEARVNVSLSEYISEPGLLRKG